VADTPDTPDEAPTPVERLDDHLAEVSRRPDEMQERLDELEESIEATRRQAQADDLLPEDDGRPTGDPTVDEVGDPSGDVEQETPVSDGEAEPGF
jgi:hypothetical protein